ncbi:hypothetical protein ACGFYU_15170 [Streptomyces sp. NPDC048337]|uniref:hypothetical protein n=1 Tax=Streptomyces sp. NPDC048337 TaxID=3365535 RepID=UPI003723C5BE
MKPERRGRRLELGRLPSSCSFESVREVDGDTEHSDHFSLTVYALPQKRAPYIHEIGVDDKPFGDRSFREDEDATAQVDYPSRSPLGDGLLGDHGRKSATVTAGCEGAAGSRPTSVSVRVGGEYKEEATDTDLRALAQMARKATADAARRLGCKTTLPELPARLTMPSLDLGPAESGQGTCGWYASMLRGTAERGRLPDRSVGAPTASATRGESCVLAMSPDGVRRIFPELTPAERGGDDARSALTRRPWWIRTQSYFGDEAEATMVTHDYSAKPVTVLGAGRDRTILYASATCQGRPAAFTMNADATYSRVLGGRTAEVFKAYVGEAAARRGCTDLKLPE